jgi:hypothetical protein
MKLSELIKELQLVQSKIDGDPDMIVNIGRHADNVSTTTRKPYKQVMVEGWQGHKKQALAND